MTIVIRVSISRHDQGPKACYLDVPFRKRPSSLLPLCSILSDTTMSCLTCSSFPLRLPPALRASVLYNGPNRCAFSASTSRRVSFAEVAISGPAAVLNTFHAIVPWYAAIPLTAILIRGTFGYYAVSKPARQREIIRRSLQPLAHVQALRKYIDWRMWRDQKLNRSKTEEDFLLLKRIERPRLWWTSISTMHSLGKQYNAAIFTWRGFLNFGALIAFTEALRVKCGANQGLLPMILNPLEAIVLPQKHEPAQPATNADELLAERLQQAWEAKAALPDGEAYHLPPLNSNAYANLVDYSLQAEGFGWITDLTVSDATLILPLTLSALIAGQALVNVKGTGAAARVKLAEDELQAERKRLEMHFERTMGQKIDLQLQAANDVKDALAAAKKINAERSVANRKTDEGPLAWLSTQQKIGLSMSIIFFFIGAKLPVALLLYIIPHFAVGYLQRVWLDIKYPLPSAVEACKRPLRAKEKKMYSEV